MTRKEPSIHPESGLWGGQMIRFRELDSTNAAALAHGDVVQADAQSEGRGRRGRFWLAPAGQSIALSVVVSEPRFVSLAANLGQLAALAVSDAMSAYGLHAMFKWPNDVMIADAKVAGILAERADTGAFILGIGLNVNVSRRDFAAAKLDRPATSLRLQTGRRVSLRDTRRLLLGRLERRLEGARERGIGELLAAWRQSDWLLGRAIRLTGIEPAVEGRYLGLDAEGRLVLQAEDGASRAYWSGDVERVEPLAAGRAGDRPAVAPKRL